MFILNINKNIWPTSFLKSGLENVHWRTIILAHAASAAALLFKPSYIPLARMHCMLLHRIDKY